MRFIETGPDIPDDLLVARDEGRVLFFCGAGVSLARAKLPDFLKLAGDVMDDLGSLDGSQARRLFEAGKPDANGRKSYVPVDRMFSALDQEFEPREVRDAVARALKPAVGIDLSAHRTILDLSRGADGRPRLITTNFDLLFEECQPLQTWGPPTLPLPERPIDFAGVVHLHGRTNEDYSGISDDEVVLSSSDFGKAYLSDGWATRYIRGLMGRFKIVFLGYSADDPPVQYLLEALREDGPVANLYAFQHGDEAQAREQWLQKGVVPIAFGFDYANLWDTLTAWAERARDLDAWVAKVLAQAANGPSTATSTFRGQIAHLASTQRGMNQISRADPPLPSAWLYTFDPRVRYLKPMSADRYDHTSPLFNPFEHFAIDRDELPEPIDRDDYLKDRPVPKGAWDAFEATAVDRTASSVEPSDFYSPAPVGVRMWDLQLLILRRMDEAPTLWWAAGQSSMHPNVVRQLEEQLRYRLRDSKSPYPRYWRYLLESWRRKRLDLEQAALDIQHRAKRDGWSNALVREAADLCRSRIVVKRAAGPPLEVDADPTGFLSLDVEYPRPHADFKFSPEYLPLAASLWRQLLLEGEHLEIEIGGWVSIESTRPEDGKRLDPHAYGMSGPFFAYVLLLEALEKHDPSAVIREMKSWDAHEATSVKHLRVWASGRAALTTSEEAGRTFTSLTDEDFWSHQLRRDLRLALVDRWNGLPEESRRVLETRILHGAIPHTGDAGDNMKAWIASDRLNAIHYLATHGAQLGFDVEAEKKRLLTDAPDWTQEQAEGDILSGSSGVYSVTTDTDPSTIADLPIDQILPIAAQPRKFRQTVEHDPFSGLAAKDPDRALAAIASATRRSVPELWPYWLSIFRATADKATSDAFDTAVVQAVRSMEPNDVARIWYPLVDWLAKRASKFEARELGEFDAVWDAIIAAARIQPSGYKPKRDRDWSFEALNSIAGRLTQCLLEMTPPSSEVPASWLARLDKVLGLPGDHSRHALYIVVGQLRWLEYHEPKWTMAQVVSRSHDGDDADAFWAGFTRVPFLPREDLFSHLKADLLSRVHQGTRESRSLIGYLLGGWGAVKGPKLISDVELRGALVLTNDEVRRSLLHVLQQSALQDADWRTRVIPFFRDVWPKQRTLKTPEMSSYLFRVASAFPDLFSEILKLIMVRFVRLTRGHGLHVHAAISSFDAQGLHAMVAALSKLLPEDRADWPYEAKTTIKEIKETGLINSVELDRLVRRADELNI